MAPTAATTSDADLEAAASPASSPNLAEGDQAYVDPDLSFRDGVPELVGEEKEWAEARDNARKEGLKAAVEHEKKIGEQRAKEREEADAASAEQRKQDAALQKSLAGLVSSASTPTKTTSGSSGATS